MTLVAGAGALAASAPLSWASLGLSPIAFEIGPLPVRWYALSFLAMLLLGWWYVHLLLRRPGALMRPEWTDDLVTYVTVGVIAGGRLGYSLFYRPEMWARPIEVLRMWEGGMSFHGGLIGLVLALWLFARRRDVDLLRLCDHIACATPFGLVLVRLANFVNGELWGRPTTMPWGMTFPGAGDDLPRHPSQLYEAALEGVVMAAVLSWMFWRTDARMRRGRLLGTGLLIYGVARFFVEFLRQPDRGMEDLPWGLTMGQTLTVPMIVAGAWFLRRSFAAPAVGALEPARP